MLPFLHQLLCYDAQIKEVDYAVSVDTRPRPLDPLDPIEFPNGVIQTQGEPYANAFAAAIVRLLDVEDARDKELQALNQKTSRGYLPAVGIQVMHNTQFGRVLMIQAGSRNPGPFEAVNSKWSEVVTGWMTALEQ